MPVIMPVGSEAWIAKQSGGNAVPVVLADIQTPDGTNYFWSDREDVYTTELPVCTRIQTAGGTSTSKYFWSGPIISAGQPVHMELKITNNGLAPVKIAYNNSTGPALQLIAPSSSAWIKIDYTNDGVARQVQLVFSVNTSTDSLDVLSSDPMVTINGIDQGVPSNFAGSGWDIHDTAVATLTQSVAGPKLYSGWIKNGFTFTRSRDNSTDFGDLVVQNISGNTIDRDVAGALVKRAWIGSFAIIRLWTPLLDAVLDEFHCGLSEPHPTEEECSFHLLQLFDASQYFAVQAIVSESCDLIYKGVQCGSTGAAATCDLLFATCKDANHLAQERFDGVLYIISGAVAKPLRINSGGSLRGGPLRSVPALL